LASATGFLRLDIEEASTLSRAADFATIEQTRALDHALRSCSPTRALAFLWIAWPLACAKEVWLTLSEGGVLSESIQASATTAISVGVVAHIKMISIVTHKELWPIQRLKGNGPFI
jgi:hypothetical protein